MFKVPYEDQYKRQKLSTFSLVSKLFKVPDEDQFKTYLDDTIASITEISKIARRILNEKLAQLTQFFRLFIFECIPSELDFTLPFNLLYLAHFLQSWYSHRAVSFDKQDLPLILAVLDRSKEIPQYSVVGRENPDSDLNSLSTCFANILAHKECVETFNIKGSCWDPSLMYVAVDEKTFKGSFMATVIEFIKPEDKE
ncbi:hypothetical protein GEMRC1_000830 [Eukaryota sp. GEM-RC1]